MRILKTLSLLGMLLCVAFSADAKNNSVTELMVLSGIDTSIKQSYGLINSVLAAIDAKVLRIDESVVKDIHAEFEKADLEARMRHEVAARLGETISQPKIDELLQWYRSDAGRAITAAEVNGQTPLKLAEAFKNADTLLADQALSSYASSINTLTGAYRASKQHSNALLSLFDGLSQLEPRPKKSGSLAKVLAKCKGACLEDKAPKPILAILANAYQSISLDQREAYQRFLETQTARDWHKESIDAMVAAVSKTSDTTLETINAYVLNFDRFRALLDEHDLDKINTLITTKNINSRAKFNKHTPLMEAMSAYPIDEQLIKLLLDKGARITSIEGKTHSDAYMILSIEQNAIKKGSIELIKLLNEYGANWGYSVFKHSYGRQAAPNAEYASKALYTTAFADLIERFHRAEIPQVLEFLLAQDVHLQNDIYYVQTLIKWLALRNSSKELELISNHDIDLDFLNWTELHRLTSLQDNAGIKNLVSNLEADAAQKLIHAKDVNGSTALGFAVYLKNHKIANFLIENGANPNDLYNLETLLSLVLPFKYVEDALLGDERDQLLETLLKHTNYKNISLHQLGNPLVLAVENEDYALVDFLIENQHPTRNGNHFEAIVNKGISSEMLTYLLSPKIALNSSDLDFNHRRLLHGFPDTYEIENAFSDLSKEQLLQFKKARRGNANPENMTNAPWLELIKNGFGPYRADKHFGIDSDDSINPGWTSERFGVSVTIMEDGRIIEIGGEHEDSYDPDFFIYNDVIVYHPDGDIDILGYPVDVFHPTDFHTATLVGDMIYIIGTIGYSRDRVEGFTPVYRLNTQSYKIEKLDTKGEMPGWIYKHHAELKDNSIVIQGGTIHTETKNDDQANLNTYSLDLSTQKWRVL